MRYACIAKFDEEIGREIHLFVMNKSREVGQVARSITKAFLDLSGTPVKFVVDVTNHVVIELGGGRHDLSDPLDTAVTLHVRGSRERGPFLNTALGEGCAFPFAQPRC